MVAVVGIVAVAAVVADIAAAVVVVDTAAVAVAVADADADAAADAAGTAVLHLPRSHQPTGKNYSCSRRLFASDIYRISG